MRLCNKCELGPEGIMGHEDLELVEPKLGPRSTERFVLACMQCGARWSRVFGSDRIRWVRQDVSPA